MAVLQQPAGEVNCVIVADPTTESQRAAIQNLIRDNWSATQFSRQQTDNRLILSKGGFWTPSDASGAAQELIPKINVVASGTSTAPLLRLNGLEDIETQMILDPADAVGGIGTLLKDADVFSRPNGGAEPISVTGNSNSTLSNTSAPGTHAGPIEDLAQAPTPGPPRIDDQLTDDELFENLKTDQSQQLAEAILRSRYGLLSHDEQLAVEQTRVHIINASLEATKALTTGIKRWNQMAFVAPIFLLITIFLSATLLKYGYSLAASGAINGYEFSVVIFLAAIYAISPTTLLLLQRPLKNLEGTTVPGALPSGDKPTSDTP